MTDEDVARIVGQAWRSALGVDESNDADFFQLGGNSVVLLQLSEQLKSELNIEFPLETLMMSGRLRPLIAVCQETVRLNQAPER